MSLIELCEKGDLEGVKAALQNGADVNSKDEYGCTGLILAVDSDYNSVVELLLNTPNIDVNWENDQGHCALHVAVINQNIEALKLLLNVPDIDVSSVDMNIVDNRGHSAVYLAVYSKNNEGLELLLNVPNINVNIVDNRGRSAVHVAMYSDNIEALKLLLGQPSLTALTLNQKDKYGVTPVMKAARWNRLEHLALLAADPRVDLDTTNKEGWSLEEVAWWVLLVAFSKLPSYTWTESFLHQMWNSFTFKHFSNPYLNQYLRDAESRKVVAEAKQRRQGK